MKETAQEKKEQKKGFWARLMENIDKKMEEKSRSGCCCCSSDRSQSKGNKC